MSSENAIFLIGAALLFLGLRAIYRMFKPPNAVKPDFKPLPAESIRYYEQATQLPLMDAAYHLWLARWNLDEIEFPKPKRTVPADLKDPEVVARAMRNAIEKVDHASRTAHDGATFDRLKRAHPGARDETLKSAIKAAVKFDTDCVRYYSNQEPDHYAALKTAIDGARAANPGFSASTYARAFHELSIAMR
jgi:hypothetical protein